MKKNHIFTAAAVSMSLFMTACANSSADTTAADTISVSEDVTAEAENTSITDEATAEGAEASSASTEESAETSGESLNIVTTIFPEYDWVNNILGDNAANADVTMLLDNGVDLHSYSPTAEDIMKIANCDLFIYVGGESDEWVEDALKEKVNDDMVVINLLDTLGDTVKEEEVVEGMEAEHEHGEEGDEHEEDADEHDHEEDADEHTEDTDEHTEDADEHEEGPEYDEHVWLSLKNTETLCDAISSALQTIDSANADTYAANAKDYISKLKELDDKYSETVQSASTKTVLFGDRFPFRYLVDDYNLDYYAAFVGCSAETEASFETIAFLAGKVDELGLSTVLTIEGDDHRIAETIVQNTSSKDQQILTMDSMQSTTSADVKDGANYLSIMENNLEVLKTALN